MEIEQIAVICASAVNCVHDIRKKEILFIPTILFAGAGVVFGILHGRDAAFFLSGILPGAFLTVISYFSRQAVGFGDAVIILAVGIWCGCGRAFFTLFSALLIQSVFAIIYRAAGGKKKELPFVPALASGYLLSLAVM